VTHPHTRPAPHTRAVVSLKTQNLSVVGINKTVIYLSERPPTGGSRGSPVRVGRVRIGRVRIGRVRIGRVRTGRVRIGRVRIGRVRIGRVRIRRVRIRRVREGECV